MFFPYILRSESHLEKRRSRGALSTGGISARGMAISTGATMAIADDGSVDFVLFDQSYLLLLSWLFDARRGWSSEDIVERELAPGPMGWRRRSEALAAAGGCAAVLGVVAVKEMRSGRAVVGVGFVIRLLLRGRNLRQGHGVHGAMARLVFGDFVIWKKGGCVGVTSSPTSDRTRDTREDGASVVVLVVAFVVGWEVRHSQRGMSLRSAWWNVTGRWRRRRSWHSGARAPGSHRHGPSSS